MEWNENQTEILLEPGTNELEIMEFTIAGQRFGINVAKVREIMKISGVNPMPHSHPSIEGVFKPRDEVITVVNLARYLGLAPSPNDERDIFIIANFNGLCFAFHVHSVEGIDRISWSEIQKPDPIIYGGEDGVATGIAQVEDRLITILDFEKIIAEISPQTSIRPSELDGTPIRPERANMPVLIAEDSMLLSKLIAESLERAGYTNLQKANNGEEAWDLLQEARERENPAAEVACLITDIEMPRMDGLHLTQRIKTDQKLKAIPVILFSSLINEEMRLKGQQVGADGQISKPEIASLVALIDRLILD